MPETLTPDEAAARLEPHRHARDPARHRPAAGVPRGARAARRLGGPADLRRPAARLVGGVQAPERPLPLGLLRPARARASRPGREHQLRPGRLPPLRAAARAAAPAGDGDRRRAARRRRLVQPLAARRRHVHGARRAPARIPTGCWWSRSRRAFPRTHGLPPEHPHALHVDQIDLLVESDAEPFALPDARAGGDRRGDRRARRPVHPRRRHAADRDRRRSRRRSSACSPTGTAATTASTRRCSPTA